MLLADKLAKALYPWLQAEWPVTADLLAVYINDALQDEPDQPSAIRGEVERHVEGFEDRLDDLAIRISKLEQQVNVFPRSSTGA